jgi:hypothetical protein
MSTTDRLVPMTDARAKPLLAGEAYAEPLPGSVVLTMGEFGTAWQRHFSDGLWHRTGGGKPKNWEAMLRQRNVVLVYDAPHRGDGS